MSKKVNLDEVNQILLEQLKIMSKIKSTDKNFNSERMKAKAIADLGNAIIHSKETELKQEMWDSGVVLNQFGKPIGMRENTPHQISDNGVSSIKQIGCDGGYNDYDSYDYCDSDDPADILEYEEEMGIKEIKSEKRK